MRLYEKSLITLELPAVLDMLAAEAVSQPAKSRAAELTPSYEKREVSRRLAGTTAAKNMITIKGSPSFSGVKDIGGALARAERGGMLNTRELLDIAGVLRSARIVRSYSSGDAAGRTEIDFLFKTLRANRFLEDRISDAITGEEEISDGASGELAAIRRHMRAAGSRAREALQKIISSPAYAKALQEPIITMRAQRFVVPVKAECRGSIPGLVHDVSSSGMTLFVEPMAAVKANNELRELQAKEEIEIDRILMELSAQAAAHQEDIARDFEILVELDLIFAKAKLSFRLDCMEPSLSEREIRLKSARHPLLPRETAVPIDVELGGSFDTLVITGPNTGGKTVSIKTIGLLCLMLQCGLHVPVSDGSHMPVFSGVLADIGDEQSIEQSLSTFSSHMKNIVKILEECTDNTLLLFDELGAGTDPVEGAALAIAIIERARSLGAVIAATTHYAELKVYAISAPGVQNASCEFDVETLRPTYRLLIGVPGKSNAFAISGRLGLPREVIEDAKNRVSTESANLEETLAKLEKQRQLMEKDRLEAATRLQRAEAAAQESERLKKELKGQLEKADERARREARRVIEDARGTAEEVFAELDSMRRMNAGAEDWQRVNEARSQLRGKLNRAEADLAPRHKIPEEAPKASRPIRPGDTVQIISMGVKAQVISVDADGGLTLQAGIMKVSAKREEVFLLENHQPPSPFQQGPRGDVKLRSEAAKPEVDLRGMTSDEAIPVMERFIDSAVMSRLESVTIIHGKGTGALRQAVAQNLKRNRQVKSFRLGRYGEGETGVTIVELS